MLARWLYLVVGKGGRAKAKIIKVGRLNKMAQVTVANKTQVAQAHKLLQSLNGVVSATPSKAGYNAYVASMLLQPGTQSQINTFAGLAPNNAHPNLHLGNPAAAKYYKAVGSTSGKGAQVAGIPFTVLMPKCTTHNTGTSHCTNTCTYGLYVVGQKAFAHTLLASGGQGSNTPTTKANPKAKAPTTKAPQVPNTAPSGNGPVVQQVQAPTTTPTT